MALSDTHWQTYTTTATVAGATEASVMTLTGPSSSYAGQTFKLHGWLAFQVAASTASVVLKIRRDSLAGTIVVTSPTYNGGDVTTPKLTAFELFGSDTQLDVASGIYVLTATLASAGGATTVSAGILEARVD